MVRPWNAFSAATMCGRPVRRAILNAASLASAPELQNSTRAGRVRPAPAAARPARSAARRRTGWTRARACASWRVTASTIAGWAWPSALTAMPDDQVQVAAAVGVPDLGTARRGPAPAAGCRSCSSARCQRCAAARLRIVAVHHGTTIVPTPSAVNTSSSTECGTRPSITCAVATPPRTARRQASIFGAIPASRAGSIGSSWSAVSSLISESGSG